MANMSSETMNKASNMVQDAKGKADSALSSLERISHDAGERIGSAASSVMETAESYTSDGRKYIEKNPIKSVAIAAAAGLLAGSLVSMLSRTRH